MVDELDNIFVLDRKENHIKVFDKSGKYIKVIGRRGQGPGELDMAAMISINAGKNELVVWQMNGRLAFFTLDGKFLRNQMLIAGELPLNAKVDPLSNIILTVGAMDPNKKCVTVKKYDSNMNFIRDLKKTPILKAGFDPFEPYPYWDIDSNGYFVYGFPKDYTIEIWDTQNRLIRKIERAYDPVDVTGDERERYLKNLSPGLKAKLDFSAAHSAFQRFFLDDQGMVFVQTWEKAEAGKKFIFDIFDKQGKFMARVPLKQKPQLLKKNKLYSIEEDEEGYQTVKRYAVNWLNQ